MSKYGILIDYEFCTGCHSCEFACRQENNLPLGQWGIKVLPDWSLENKKKINGSTAIWQFLQSNAHIVEKRLAQGKMPSCVQHCQAKVLQFGTIEELSQLLKKKSRQTLFVPK